MAKKRWVTACVLTCNSIPCCLSITEESTNGNGNWQQLSHHGQRTQQSYAAAVRPASLSCMQSKIEADHPLASSHTMPAPVPLHLQAAQDLQQLHNTDADQQIQLSVLFVIWRNSWCRQQLLVWQLHLLSLLKRSGQMLP